MFSSTSGRSTARSAAVRGYASRKILSKPGRLSRVRSPNVRGSTVDLYGVVLRLAQLVSFTFLFNEKDVTRIRQLGDLVFKYNRGNWNVFSYLFSVKFGGSCQAAEALRSYWSQKRPPGPRTPISWQRSRTQKTAQAILCRPKSSSAA